MKVIVIKSIESNKIFRGLTGKLQEYIVIDDVVNAIIIDYKGCFRVIPIDNLGVGDSLLNY